MENEENPETYIAHNPEIDIPEENVNQPEPDKKWKIPAFLSLLFIIVMVTLIGILLYNSFKYQPEFHPEKIDCLTNCAILITSKTCGHCFSQKELLGEFLNNFKVYDILESPEYMNVVSKVPAWIINNQTYYGKKTLGQIEALCNC